MPEPRDRPEPTSEPGKYAYERLERVLHERSRLGILTSLMAQDAAGDGLTFNELKSLCSLTDGNLSRQIQLLEEEGLVEVRKGTAGNRPQTRVRMTTDGRSRFTEYLEELERVVRDAMSRGAGTQPKPATRPKLA
jgi:DNA-binding MarR family transcriptional regulator